MLQVRVLLGAPSLARRVLGPHMTDIPTSPEQAIRVAALYRFAPVADPARVRERLQAVCDAGQVRGTLLVAESGIFTPDDVQRVADAHAQSILVGESLMRQEDVEAATKALLSLG